MTKPQHMHLLSGYGAVELGDVRNLGNKKLPAGWSIYERIRAGRGSGVITVQLAGRKFVGRGVTRNARRNGSLDYLVKRGQRDGFTGAGTTKRFVESLAFLGSSPFFYMLHFKTADVIGHRAGSRSVAYEEAIVQIDKQLGRVREALADVGLGDTKVFITTDHGFEKSQHQNRNFPGNLITWIAASDHSLRYQQGTSLDITPTLLHAMGVDYTLADPPMRGMSLR